MTQETTLTDFEKKLALLHAADIYAHAEVSGKYRDEFRTNRHDTDCHPSHGCGFHEDNSPEVLNPSLHKGY